MSSSLFADCYGNYDYIPNETDVTYYDGDKKFSELKAGDKVWFYRIGYEDKPYLVEVTITSGIRKRKDKYENYYRLTIPCKRFKGFPSARYKWEITYINLGVRDIYNADYDEDKIRNGSIVAVFDEGIYGTNKESLLKEVGVIIKSRIASHQKEIDKINDKINRLEKEYGKLLQLR